MILLRIQQSTGSKLDDGQKLGTLFDYGFYSFGIMKTCTHLMEV